MGKQKKRKSRLQRNAIGPYATEDSQDAVMDADDCYPTATPVSPKALREPTDTHSPLEGTPTAAKGAETEGQVGATRHVYKRQAGEWRKMKAEVAQLKKQRQKLRKKNVSQREERKRLGKLIKTKILGLRQKHDAELRSLGITSKSVHDTLPEETMCVD